MQCTKQKHHAQLTQKKKKSADQPFSTPLQQKRDSARELDNLTLKNIKRSIQATM
jgi:hypothetical protein